MRLVYDCASGVVLKTGTRLRLGVLSKAEVQQRQGDGIGSLQGFGTVFMMMMLLAIISTRLVYVRAKH